MKFKKLLIVLGAFLLLVLAIIVIYYVSSKASQSTISGVVLRSSSSSGEKADEGKGFQNTFAHAQVQIFKAGEIIKERNPGQEEVGTYYQRGEKVAELKADKNGEFLVKLPPGLYLISAYYGETYKSKKDVVVNLLSGKTERVRVTM